VPVKIAPEFNDFIGKFGDQFGNFHRAPPAEYLWRAEFFNPER
jgi:hypothetical protein